MNRVGIGLAVMTIVATPVLLDAQNWPQFRGAMAGVGVDHPDLPDSWSTTENVAWVTSIPGIGWSSPIVWGITSFSPPSSTAASRNRPSPVSISVTGRRPRRHIAGWQYDVDYASGKVRWAKEVGGNAPAKAKHLKNSYASETPVTDGERVSCTSPTWDSSRSILPVTRSGPNPSVRSRRATTGAPVRRLCFIRAVSTSSTTTTSSRSWQGMMRERARRSGVSIARRAPTGRRHSRGRTSCAPRSSRQLGSGSFCTICPKAAVGVFWNVEHFDPDALRALWPSLYQLGLHCRSDAAGVCDSSRRVGRHFVETRRDEQHIHRVVSGSRRTLQPDPHQYGDTYYTLFDRGFFTTTTRRRADLSTTANHGRGERIHLVTLLQQSSLRNERRRRYLCDPGGTDFKVLEKIR